MKPVEEILQEIVDGEKSNGRLILPDGTATETLQHLQKLAENSRANSRYKRNQTWVHILRDHFYRTIAQGTTEEILPELDELLRVLISWRFSLERRVDGKT